MQPVRDVVGVQPAGDVLIVAVHLAHHQALHVRVGGQQCLHPAGDGVVVVLHVAHQLEYALVELRQQHRGQNIEHEAHQQPCQQQAGRPGGGSGETAPLPGPLHLAGEEAGLKKIHHRRQQIGHEGAVENGPDGGHQLPPDVQKPVAPKQGIIKEQDGPHGQKHRDAALHMLAFSVHPAPPLFHSGPRAPRRERRSCRPAAFSGHFKGGCIVYFILHKGTGNCNPDFPVVYCFCIILTCLRQEALSETWKRKNC